MTKHCQVLTSSFFSSLFSLHCGSAGKGEGVRSERERPPPGVRAGTGPPSLLFPGRARHVGYSQVTMNCWSLSELGFVSVGLAVICIQRWSQFWKEGVDWRFEREHKCRSKKGFQIGFKCFYFFLLTFFLLNCFRLPRTTFWVVSAAGLVTGFTVPSQLLSTLLEKAKENKDLKDSFVDMVGCGRIFSRFKFTI